MRVSKVLGFFLFEQGEISTFRADFGKNQQVKTWFNTLYYVFLALTPVKTCFFDKIYSYFRRIINLCCISAIYANRDTTEVQDIHFRPMFEATNKALSHPSFSLSTVSLFMADESLSFHQKCALWIATSQNCPKYFHK